MKALLVVATMILTAGSAGAAVYQWVDDRGVINFTDNRDKIPPKYRAKAREKDMSDEKNIFILKGEKTPAAQSAPGGGERPAEQNQDWWRARVTTLRDQVKQSEEDLESKRKRLAELHHRRVVYQKASDRASYNRLKAEIEKDEVSLKELRERLTAAETAAASAGAPVP